ncbi:Elongation of very long chain fatty acids protein 6 [Geodia barretti]|uniref:Elongation of very long chain fatty acids protein n=1 Tax=Geodia barretti TaxID=519541 RepID=A0AA35TFU3_GEOBA|nr:Elongation of very long chain fatty acids protein 6 [Geodia barretti]
MTSLYYAYHPLELLDMVESRFDEKKAIPWMNARWHWSFYFSALYLLFIWWGLRYMKNKKPFNLRRALCMWSTLLATFSVFAIIRISSLAPQMVYLGGWRHAFCDTWAYTGSQRCGIWAFLFPFSKLPELVDTVFIVLRKQKLSFLHVFHHVSVFIYCWYSYAYPISTGVWFGIVNLTVHGIMYTYYAVKASGRYPPRWVAKVITTIQLSQMFVGIFINYIGITSLISGKTCRTSWFDVGLSIFFYVSYAVLFANFFYWAYIHPKPQKKDNFSITTSNGAPLAYQPQTKVVTNGHIPRQTNGTVH